MYDKILVAFDGSKPSIHALQHAAQLAKIAGTKKMVILHVNDEPIDLQQPVYNVELDQLIGKENHKILSTANELLLEAGIPYETHTLEGDPSEQITSYVKENPYDLIVMGSMGKGLIKGVFLGRVSRTVIHSVDCPVLIVK
ncbi:universal stress protein [Priestia aryabhattai]|uniref:universal stress protein n=1 Tax=Priestia aryabhattai TaxID=412384 RepID=UPI00187400DC|nr:universal stress protein [Priestia aryabhattai]MBE5098425.1 universal stress protein [Priestia aryabhattai]